MFAELIKRKYFEQALNYYITELCGYTDLILHDVPEEILRYNTNISNIIVDYLLFKINNIINVQETEFNVLLDAIYTEIDRNSNFLKNNENRLELAYVKYVEKSKLTHSLSNESKLITCLYKTGKAASQLLREYNLILQDVRDTALEDIKIIGKIDGLNIEDMVHFNVESEIDRTKLLSDETYDKAMNLISQVDRLDINTKNEAIIALNDDRMLYRGYLDKLLEENQNQNNSIYQLIKQIKLLTCRKNHLDKEIAEFRLRKPTIEIIPS
jgi:predicted DNA-binding protein YlxM (UPF0122 family)